MNIIGLSIPRCGTPELRVNKSERVLPIRTLWVLFERKDLNHFLVWSANPYIASFWQSRSMSNVSNAAERSHTKRPVIKPSSLFRIHSCCISKSLSRNYLFELLMLIRRTSLFLFSFIKDSLKRYKNLLTYLLTYLLTINSHWMIAQMLERLLCTRRTRVQIPALAPYEITL